jgi:hypothetical protein
MRHGITFSRRQGGFVVALNGMLRGLILSPESDGGSIWRFISQWGDVSEHPNLVDAQTWASEVLLLDSHYPA